MLTVDTHLKVQMRSGGPAGGTDLRNRRTAGNHITDLNINGAQILPLWALVKRKGLTLVG